MNYVITVLLWILMGVLANGCLFLTWYLIERNVQESTETDVKYYQLCFTITPGDTFISILTIIAAPVALPVSIVSLFFASLAYLITILRSKHPTIFEKCKLPETIIFRCKKI